MSGETPGRTFPTAPPELADDELPPDAPPSSNLRLRDRFSRRAVALASATTVGVIALVTATAWPHHELDVAAPIVPTHRDGDLRHAIAIAPAPQEPDPPRAQVDDAAMLDAPVQERAEAAVAMFAPPPRVRPVPKTAEGRAARLVDKICASSTQRPGRADPITDEFGRVVGQTHYKNEKETNLPLRLNAVVDPQQGPAFAIIEDKDTGMVASYREGGMLWPGTLPGVWVLDVDAGVVHLLDLKNNAFEYLTFAKPPPRKRTRRRSPHNRQRSTRRG